MTPVIKTLKPGDEIAFEVTPEGFSKIGVVLGYNYKGGISIQAFPSNLQTRVDFNIDFWWSSYPNGFRLNQELYFPYQFTF